MALLGQTIRFGLKPSEDPSIYNENDKRHKQVAKKLKERLIKSKDIESQTEDVKEFKYSQGYSAHFIPDGRRKPILYIEQSGSHWICVSHYMNKAGKVCIFVSETGKINALTRIAYEQANNVKLTKDDIVVNTCGVKGCFNPDHLLLINNKSESIKYQHKKGIFKDADYRYDKRTKLTENQVIEIFTSSLNRNELAVEYNITPENVDRIHRRKIWASITKNFQLGCDRTPDSSKQRFKKGITNEG